MRFRTRRIILLVLLFAVPTTLFGQVEDDEFRSGLIGRYSDQTGNSFLRRDETISISPGNVPIDRRLEGDSLRIRWTGFLMSQALGDYRLHVYGTGDVQITLDGESVLRANSETPQWSVSDPLPLQFDFHPLEVNYDRNDAGDGIRLFWSGPQFQLEPIGSRYLFHEPAQTPDASIERGELMVRALRCAACHQIPGESHAANAPSLAHVEGNLHSDWIVDWLANPPTEQEGVLRRMPHFAISKSEAAAIAAYLFKESKAVKRPSVDKKKVDLAKGEQLLLTTGCLACHRVGEIGESGLFGGGDLTKIAAKRPRDFFAHWLVAPGELNATHRMPVFALSKDELRDLAAHLSTLGTAPEQSEKERHTNEQVALGRQLFEKHQCAACHEAAMPEKRQAPRAFAEAIRWENSCAGKPNGKRPGYGLTEDDQIAVARFIDEARKHPNTVPRANARQLLTEQNCLACHLRDDSPGLAAKLPAVAESHPEVAELLPAMTPPPLISVGDKLYEQSIRDAIERKSVHRDYLHVRMPKFNLSEEQLKSLVDYFVQSDRLPPRTDQQPPPTTDPLTLHTVGSRLVTTDGFGCTSCHQLGSVEPTKAPLNARGPQLTLLAKRIRREWFERFVRNPLRVIPRMEMPSVQVAVSGILDNNLDAQLAAVWDVLNTPGFEPPLPDPVRTVRHSGFADREERAVVITDVVRNGEQTYLKPLLVGLPNRTSFLFDLETAALVQWSVGDIAQERTEGKTWFWTTAGTPLLKTEMDASELSMIEGSHAFAPETVGQFVTEFDEAFHTDDRGLGFRYRLKFDDPPKTMLAVTQTFNVESYESGAATRKIEVVGLPKSASVKLQLLASSESLNATIEANQITTRFGSLVVLPPQAIADDFSVTVPADGNGIASIAISYRPLVPIDVFPTVAPTAPAPPPLTLDVVPGFEAIRLPISSEFMPTAMDWRPSGELVVASLKGRIWNLRDTDNDGLEDEAVTISDELAAPYGIAAYDDYVDVVNKYGLLRVQRDRMVTIASGWGHTTDYHDWAVGLPRDREGNYYVALPCQQDQRSAAAARYKGSVLKLSPREPTASDPSRFAIEELTAGHRFPMGIARNKAGEMFVTDNQGNYNPFNELNHIVPGKRFGFINAIDRKPGFKPPLTSPAIDIPHPWTRSVNGICFLESPESSNTSFGPFEGHLIGCEYDTRRLIRMSLQMVGGEYQGAAYPFSYDAPRSGPPLLGPLVCAVSPQGDLYVGGIRDSGWGGSNNIGEIVRLRPKLDQLPCGIAEVRATSGGFIVEFTEPVDRSKASKPDNYAVSSYTRTSTPAYGGEDQDRRQEQVTEVQVAEDARRVEIRLGDLRVGYVYELHLKNLAPETGEFFPAEAHYTLRSIPK
ncbi:MAG: c-type cytochrome [Planctomycetaceae bacterium]|nr:c-type cytochrome [Planctomycetaceae bacterium]